MNPEAAAAVNEERQSSIGGGFFSFSPQHQVTFRTLLIFTWFRCCSLQQCSFILSPAIEPTIKKFRTVKRCGISSFLLAAFPTFSWLDIPGGSPPILEESTFYSTSTGWFNFAAAYHSILFQIMMMWITMDDLILNPQVGFLTFSTISPISRHFEQEFTGYSISFRIDMRFDKELARNSTFHFQKLINSTVPANLTPILHRHIQKLFFGIASKVIELSWGQGLRRNSFRNTLILDFSATTGSILGLNVATGS